MSYQDHSKLKDQISHCLNQLVSANPTLQQQIKLEYLISQAADLIHEIIETNKTNNE